MTKGVLFQHGLNVRSAGPDRPTLPIYNATVHQIGEDIPSFNLYNPPPFVR